MFFRSKQLCPAGVEGDLDRWDSAANLPCVLAPILRPRTVLVSHQQVKYTRLKKILRVHSISN